MNAYGIVIICSINFYWAIYVDTTPEANLAIA